MDAPEDYEAVQVSEAGPPCVTLSDAMAPLESILYTEELKRRPARTPNYAAENRALLTLAQALVDSPRTILQTLSDTVMALLHADSAGLSLLTPDEKRFHWPAIAGMWSPHTGGGTPREFGPCGDVLDCNTPLLFKRFERRYPYLLEATPMAEECLLVPFYVGGRAVGTIWAIAHNAQRQFDAEDLRQLESLGKFASSAYQATESLNTEKEFNRSIIDSSPDCIKVLDLEGNLLSMHNGLALLGIEDIRPFVNKSWIAFWEGDDVSAAQKAVAAATAGRQGRFVGFFRTLRGEPKWWDVVISPMLDTHGTPTRLLAVSRDVTERKWAETNLNFLSAITQDLAKSTGLDETIANIGAKIGAYFGLSRFAFADINESVDEAVIARDWHRDDVPGLVGMHRLADFVGEEFVRVARAGETIVVRDTAADARTHRETFAAMQIASFVCVPLIRDGLWRSTLCFYHSAPYPWRQDEIELTRELSERIWTRLEHLRSEEALHQRNAQFEALFNHTPLCVFLVDAEFRIRHVNPMALPVFGNIPDLLGRDFAEVMHILWASERADETIRLFRHTLETGAPCYVPEQIERRADLQVTEYYEWQINSIPLPDGSQGVVCYFRDISEPVRAQQQIVASEQRYRNLFNSMDEGYCIIEMIFDELSKPVDWLYLEVNPAFGKLTGLHEAAGRRVLELIPGHDEHWFEIYGKVALTGEAIRFVSESKALGRSFDLYAFRIGGADRRTIAVLFTNITEHLQAQQALGEAAHELAELARRKDEFLAMLSHELRNPLAPIANAVKILQLQQNKDSIQQQAHAIIERQVGNLKHLIDDLLEVSRITTGQIQLQRGRIDVRCALDRAMETARPLIVQRRHELTLSVPPQPLWLYADAARLEQVVVNLLTNAAKYTDEGGQLWLSVEQEGDTAVLRVRDTGIGIAAELLPHIFDMFTQAERSLDRAQGGLGIGLCLVQRLVNLHGGSVEAKSVVGEGSEFVVRLPLMLASMAPLPLPLGTADTASLSGEFRRVLVIDDNADAALSLGMLLRASGHEVRMAYDGLGAVEAALDFRPDMMVIDIGLPGFSGLEVAKRIRKIAPLENIVLVALTGYGQATDRARALEAGFNHHLVKPTDFDEVQKILTSVTQNPT